MPARDGVVMDRVEAISRPRALLLSALGVVAALAWWALTGLTAGEDAHAWHMAAMSRPLAEALAQAAIMWALMLVAMMLPTAAPLLLALQQVQRQRGEWVLAAVLPGALGYLLVWLLFSIAVSGVQQWLHRQAMPMLLAVGDWSDGLLLLLAGGFQWSTLKTRCLSKCRSPLAMLLAQWRPGASGALRMGVRHGLYCLGCCWALMLLMFIGGAMSLGWMALLSMVMLAEKLTADGAHFGRALGAALIVAGLWQLATPWLG